MLDMLKSLLNEIKKNGLFPIFSHKNISIIGVIVLIIYLIRIDHYPSNISLENGVTILLVSYISGLYYTLLWCATISLGWAILNIINKAAKISKIKAIQAIDNISETDKPDYHERIIRFIFATILASITFLSSGCFYAALVAIVSTCLYATAAIFAYAEKSQKIGQDSKVAKTEISLFNLLAITLLSAPITMASIYNLANIGKLVDGTMGIVGIRVENKDIYIKAPYGELFSANSGNTTPVGNNFIILKNAKILLNDIGGETLISYGDAKTAKRLSIPSAYVSIGEIFELNKNPSTPREPSAVGSQK